MSALKFLPQGAWSARKNNRAQLIYNWVDFSALFLKEFDFLQLRIWLNEAKRDFEKAKGMG